MGELLRPADETVDRDLASFDAHLAAPATECADAAALRSW
jgi:hypothetical protein